MPNAGYAVTTDTKYYTDLEYFRSGELGMSYNYYNIKPQADADVAPSGTAALMRFRYLRTEHADSLTDQVAYYIPVGMYSNGAFQIQQYQPDEHLDRLRPLRRRDDINEYFMFLQHFSDLPFFNHNIGGTMLMAYRDIQLKDSNKGEGSGYNWPLKYYLGGSGLLSGYPYFSFWGSKLFYTRLDYYFPTKEKNCEEFHGHPFAAPVRQRFLRGRPCLEFRENDVSTTSKRASLNMMSVSNCA